MILEAKGKLSVAQTIASAQTDDSDNVIQYAAVDYAAMTDLWWVVDTNVAATGDGSDTFGFDLVMSQEATLDTNKVVCSVDITGIADLRLATAGRHIVALNVGKMLKDMLETDGSDYPFVGMIVAVSAGAQLVIDASLSPTEPHTIHHKMVVTSPVGVPAIASAGSGE